MSSSRCRRKACEPLSWSGSQYHGLPSGRMLSLVEMLADGGEAVALEAVEGLLAPGCGQFLWLPYLASQPVAEPSGHVLAERRAGLQRRHRGVEQDALLVDDLDEGDRRVLGVGQAGVRVSVLEQVDHLADLHVLQLGRVVDRAVRRGDPAFLVEGAEFVEVRHVLPVGGAELQRAEVGREHHVDSGLLELGDLVVHPVEARRVELDAAILRLDAGPARPVGELVQPHRVDAVFRIERGPLVGQLSFRRAGAVAQVQAPQLDGLAVVEKFVLPADDAAVLARGLLDPVLHADLAGFGRVSRLECIPR